MRSTVTNGLCEHASSAFIFASMGIVLRAASTLEIKIASSAHFVSFPLRGISLL